MSETVPKTAGLTEEWIAETARRIRELPQGDLPYEIFRAIAEKVTTPIIELVPIRRDADGRTAVLLIERDDEIWKGMLAVPGTVVRSKDTDPENADAFHRLLEGELAGSELSAPVLSHPVLHRSERGQEQSMVYWAEVRGEPSVGAFYPADSLPDNIVPSQLDFIPLAVHNYESSQAVA